MNKIISHVEHDIKCKDGQSCQTLYIDTDRKYLIEGLKNKSMHQTEQPIVNRLAFGINDVLIKTCRPS